MRHMVTTIEIIIDEDLPITVKGVVASLQPVKVIEFERPDLIYKIGGQKIVEFGFGIGVFQSNKNPLLPLVYVDWNKTVHRSIKTAHSRKVGCPFQLACQRIGPAMI